MNLCAAYEHYVQCFKSCELKKKTEKKKYSEGQGMDCSMLGLCLR